MKRKVSDTDTIDTVSISDTDTISTVSIDSFDDFFDDLENEFEESFESGFYPTDQSVEKYLINKLLVKFINKSNISLEKQSALILESIQLNTINALLNNNSDIVIYVPECINETCYKIAEEFYNKYGEKYRKQVIFYPGIKLDKELIERRFCKRLPNIIFADFTNTFYSNKDTVQQIFKCAKENNTDNLVLGLTFSMRSEYHSIPKLKDCNIIRGKSQNSDENVMNCITLSLLRIFYENGFTFSDFDRYIYARKLSKGRGGRMALYLFNLTKIKPENIIKETKFYTNLYLNITDYPIKRLNKE